MSKYNNITITTNNTSSDRKGGGELMRKKKVLLLLILLIPVIVFFLVDIPLFPSLLAPICNTIPTTDTPDVCHPGKKVYGEFCLHSPYEDQIQPSEDNLTLSTQGTIEFLHHVVVLCSRWQGPISVAVYSPTPLDQVEAVALVSVLRRCHTCVRRWVSWHFFHRITPTSPNNIVGRTVAPEFPVTAEECDTFLLKRQPKKRPEGDTYPINVGRNIARSQSRTPYVFATDIELYPSMGILPKFENMLTTLNETEVGRRQVWAVPVFEVAYKYRAPTHKAELKSMFAQNMAISFHRFRCNPCHMIPNLTQWMQTGITHSEVEENLEPLRIWKTVKRTRKFGLGVWEPFFIGTKTGYPEFDIRLSWEGKQNKMQVAFEMCILDYDFNIVENAFMVHSPGINVYNATKEKFRDKYFGRNDNLIKSLRKDLFKRYPGKRKEC